MVPGKVIDYARKNNYYINVGVLRRYPIHRVFNNIAIKMVKGSGSVIQIHPDTMKLMDGDSDGDIYYLAFIKRHVDTGRIWDKYKPTSLMKGVTDISIKKKQVRHGYSSKNLRWAQNELKWNK